MALCRSPRARPAQLRARAAIYMHVRCPIAPFAVIRQSCSGLWSEEFRISSNGFVFFCFFTTALSIFFSNAMLAAPPDPSVCVVILGESFKTAIGWVMASVTPLESSGISFLVLFYASIEA